MTHRASTRILGLTLVLAALAPLACHKPAPPPDRIFLITIDTLRADHLSLYGYARETSPFLDSLGAKGQVFETAFASCSHTAPSHASLFTSLHPAQHRVLQNGEELNPSVLTLAQILRERGYRTAGFTTVSFLKGLEAGFEDFHSRKRFFPATEILGEAHEWIRAQDPDAPLFAWIHLFDVHQWDRDSHVNRETLKEIKASDLRGEELLDYKQRNHGTQFERGRQKILKAVNRYDGQILSADRAIEAFFTSLEEQGLAENALWVVTSDHGEGLGNHNYMGHGKTLYTEQIRVPLLFYFSDQRFAPRRVEGLVRLVDVAPTVTELVGTSFDAQVIPPVGRSFLPLLRGDAQANWDVRSVFAQRRPADEKRLASGWVPGDVFALRNERFKVIAHSEGPPEFYDLERDPFELENLVDDPPDEPGRMLEGLLRRYDAMVAEGDRLGTGAINPEYVKELEALGYL